MESSNVFDALADEDDYGDDGEPTPPSQRSPRALTSSGLQRLTPNSRAILAARAARSRLTRSSQGHPQPAVDPQPSYADVLQASLGTRGQTQPQTRTTRPAPTLEQQAQADQASSNATGQQQTSAPQGLGDLVHRAGTWVPEPEPGFRNPGFGTRTQYPSGHAALTRCRCREGLYLLFTAGYSALATSKSVLRSPGVC